MALGQAAARLAGARGSQPWLQGGALPRWLAQALGNKRQCSDWLLAGSATAMGRVSRGYKGRVTGSMRRAYHPQPVLYCGPNNATTSCCCL